MYLTVFYLLNDLKIGIVDKIVSKYLQPKKQF